MILTTLNVYSALALLCAVWCAVQGWVLYCVVAVADVAADERRRTPLPVFIKGLDRYMLLEMALHAVFAFAVLAVGHYVAFGFHLPFLFHNLKLWADQSYGFDLKRIHDPGYVRRRRAELMFKFVMSALWTLLSLGMCGLWLLSFMSHHYKRAERLYRRWQMFLYRIRSFAHAV